MIYTSYFGNVDNLLKAGFKVEDLIGISLYKCKFLKFDIQYEKRFFPKSSLLWDLKSNVIDWKEYCLNYYNHLYNLEWVFWRDFEKNFDGKVLLCYEKNYKNCHRYLIGKFFNWWSGKKEVVNEF